MFNSLVANTNVMMNKRQIQITELLHRDGSVRVKELSEIFNVSQETIRRDLALLEKNGFLKRIHGGAVLKERKQRLEIPVLFRAQKNIEEKKMIGKKAASFINDGDIIAIDASTTGLELTKHIKNKNITVITNSIPVSLELLSCENITVILIGGYLSKESVSLVGNFSESVLKDYHVDKFFFSCNGINLERGISEIHEEQALVKRVLISISDQLILIADHSKFGVKSLFRLCNITDIDCLITDNKVALEEIREINKMGIETYIANDK